MGADKNSLDSSTSSPETLLTGRHCETQTINEGGIQLLSNGVIEPPLNSNGIEMQQSSVRGSVINGGSILVSGQACGILIQSATLVGGIVNAGTIGVVEK